MFKFQQLLLLLQQLLHHMLMLMKQRKVIMEEVKAIGVVIAKRVLLHPIHLLYLWKQRRKTKKIQLVQNWKLVELEVPRKMTPHHPAVLVWKVLYLQIINMIQIGQKRKKRCWCWWKEKWSRVISCNKASSAWSWNTVSATNKQRSKGYYSRWISQETTWGVT